MEQILLSVSAAILAMLLLISIASTLTRKRADVQNRIRDLATGTAEERPVKKKRRKRVKETTAAMKTKKQMEKLENELYDTGVKIPVSEFLLLWASLVFCFPTLLVLLGVPVAICLGACCFFAFGPILLVKLKKKKRVAFLESQLVEAISVLTNALRAGHSFQAAMNNITVEMSGPIAEEFGRVFRETQHGMMMADSMERMVERTGSADLEMLCTAILIQRDVGGNLAEVLENIAMTIQRRLSLKAEIKTRTASGRLSGYIIAVLPILLLGGIYMLNPEYCGSLFTTQLGHILLIASAVMEVIGFLAINKIVSIKY